MEIVSHVATWAGLILGISSTVLAIVTIVFARASDVRSDRINQQSITSLQRIEGVVERLSQDTNGLIKAAWDKMLQPDAGNGNTSEVSFIAKEDLDNAMAEVRAEIRSAEKADVENTPNRSLENLERKFANLERAFDRQLAAARPPSTSDYIGRLTKDLEGVTSTAVEIARALLEGGRHLTQSQMTELLDTPLGAPLSELVAAQILVPLRGARTVKEENPRVYWFPPNVARAIESSLMLAGRNSKDEAKRVRRYLQTVGYDSDSESNPSTAPATTSRQK